MSSRRQEERNEKIIRGLMKLPPNRRCINCNSVGPQYVCTNFWTFICISCSGIHREFTHRVKSVSMAKFTSEEVDALQKGGNQRARELYLKAWPQKLRLPDNSNTDKVRDFIKNVYVHKKYSIDESSDATPSRDTESLTSQENETRRASSYHSFSQSPPYDFQYEERRYGKHAPSFTRKPGSGKGLYDGKLASFLSPTRLSRHANDGSDYSLSPASQRGNGSPLSETSRDISREVPQVATSRSNGDRASHPQRTASFGSSVSSKPDHKSVQQSLDKSSSLPSLPQSSGSTTFGGLDLFSAPFAPQNVTSTTSTGTNVNLIQQSPISSVPTFTDQQPSQISQPSPLDLLPAQSEQQLASSADGKVFDVVMPNTEAWATFETPRNVVPMGTENFAPSSDGKISETFSPFVMDQSSHYQESHAFGHESRQNVVPTIHNPHSWNAYSGGGHPIEDVLQRNEQAASSIDKSLSFGGYEAFGYGNIKMLDKSEPSSSSLSSNFSMVPNGCPMVPAGAGLHSFGPNHKPTNPFDLPGDSEMESRTMSQFWDMSSLQAALPNGQPPPAAYVGGVNQSWFPPNSVPSHVPAGVSYDPRIGALGHIAGQAPTAQMPNIPAQGHFASVRGNPFA